MWELTNSRFSHQSTSCHLYNLKENVHVRLSLELSCYYWCWCSALGDLIIPADSLGTNLGIGLSITFKAGVELLRWLWGAVAQWSEHLQLKQQALGSIPGSYPAFFSTSSWFTNVDGMKDMWCSSTVQLLSTTDMNGVKDLWCSSTVQLLSTQI